ncbi:ABC transporter substrate-binding protein [Demequina pelophila]|uniref:ABC transporter substrate-binding protein n=1 Tax=Demequina pelophila TaxID=1638984 RepID=UPI000782B251|nr:ABC transporter substrate-binding protein [Demequina pelophila]
MRKLPVAVAFAATAAVALSACTNASETEGSGDSEYPVFDVAAIAVDEAAAALVPADIADSGVLTFASETSYAPAEFLDVDGTTPIGYDIDIAKAIAATLGLEAQLETASFDSIIPAIGSKFDAGISSFTITTERLGAVDMTQYIAAGEGYAVQTGNPGGFSADNLCGATVAVQVGTIQEDEIADTAAQCEADGADELEILTYQTNADATTNVVGGKADVLFADSPIIGYAIEQTGKLEWLGEPFATAAQGVVTEKDSELTAAVSAALQALMDNGTLDDILSAWGVADAGLDEATTNPSL